MPAPPSGVQYEIAAGPFHAVITESGATLRELRVGQRHLIDGFGVEEMARSGRGQVLIPWPNRIRDGHYRFAGTEHQLAISEPKFHNASHGLVRWARFDVIEHEPHQVTLATRVMAQPGYPWSLTVQVDYRLDADGLRVRHRAVNEASTTAPYAAGMHPYLRAGDSPCHSWELTVPAATRLRTDDRLLPVDPVPVAGTAYDLRHGPRLGRLRLDDAFTDLGRDEHGWARVRLWDPEAGTGVELWADRAHRWLQLYTGAGDSVAVEPMTGPADCFNSGIDLVRLDPGATFEAQWGVRPL